MLITRFSDVPGRPGAFKLNSAQVYAFNLRVALDRHHAYVNDPANKAELDQLNDSRQPYTLFPAGYYPRATVPALYVDAATRDARAYAWNGRLAEIAWERVQYGKLATTLALADQHHAAIRALRPINASIDWLDAQNSGHDVAGDPSIGGGNSLIGVENSARPGATMTSNGQKREADDEIAARIDTKGYKSAGGEAQKSVSGAGRPLEAPPAAPKVEIKL